MVSDVGIPFSSGNEAFALMFPYFRFFESIIDVNRAHGSVSYTHLTLPTT